MSQRLRGATLALLMASALCAQGNPTMRWHDLGGADWRLREMVQPPISLPLQEAFASRDLRWTGPAAEPMSGSDSGFEALRLVLGAEALESIEVLHLTPGAMLVRADEATHTRIGDAIRALREEFTRRATVKIYRAPAERAAGLEGAILKPDAVQRWVQSAEAEIVATGHLPLGGGSRLLTLESVEVPGGLSVEVAGTAAIGQLDTHTVPLGFDLCLRLHDQLGGGVFIAYALCDSRLLDRGSPVKTGEALIATEQALLTRDLPEIQLVSTAGLLARGSASVPAGGGILLLETRRDSSFAFLICVEPDARGEAFSQGSARLWPMGRLCAESFASPLIKPALQGHEQEQVHADEEPGAAPLQLDTAAELVGQLLGEAEGTGLLAIGDQFLVRVPAEQQARIGEMLQATELVLGRTLAFDVRFGELDREQLQAAPADIVQRLSGRALITAREGDPIALIAGHERTRIARHEVEIAQQATVPAPTVAVHFEGLSLSGRFEAVDDRIVHGSMAFAMQDELDRQNYPVTRASALELDLSTSSILSHTGAVRWTLGQWNLVVAQPHGDQARVVLVRPTLAP